MKTIPKDQWETILRGANLFGTGGGGTIKAAQEILKNIKKPVKLISQKELRSNDMVCTVFGVGGKLNCDPVIASKSAISGFQKIQNQKIAAMMPVEVGPVQIANVMFLSSELNIPVLDSDIVGLRSSPEIFIETISIKDLERTPCVIADDKENIAVLLKSQNIEQFETFMRNFAIAVGGTAYIAGYPLLASQLKGVVPDKSISIAAETGEQIIKLKQKETSLPQFCRKTQWKLIDEGTISKQEKDAPKGFIQGFYEITNKKNTYKLVLKNENIVLLKNKKELVTCPDSISLLDLDTFEGVNNFDEKNQGKKVAILARKAIPIWRSKKGTNLFSPKKLGLPYQQKLLA